MGGWGAGTVLMQIFCKNPVVEGKLSEIGAYFQLDTILAQEGFLKEALLLDSGGHYTKMVNYEAINGKSKSV